MSKKWSKKRIILTFAVATTLIAAAAFTAWWFGPERLTVYLRHNFGTNATTTVSIDGIAVIEVRNMTVTIHPPIYGWAERSVSRGEHTIHVEDETHRMIGEERVSVVLRTWCLVGVHNTTILITCRNSPTPLI